MKLDYFIIVFILVSLVEFTLSIKSHSKSLIPTTFQDGIIQLGEYRNLFENTNNRSTSRYGYSIVRDYDYLIDKFYQIKDAVYDVLVKNDYEITSNLMDTNISSDCLLQSNYVLNGLKRKKYFAMKFFDAYGKPPSGIFNGNLAWLGEFGECRNLTAMKGNLTGKYCLISTPLDSTSVFRPNITSLSLKYGTCIPNKCSQQDVYNIIMYFINQIPPNVTQNLPFTLNITTDYIQIQEMKELDTAAYITLSIIASIVFVVLIATLVDIYKRYRFHLKCIELLSNSNLSIDSSGLTGNEINSNENNTSNNNNNNNNSEINNSDYSSNRENVYLLSINHEHIIIQLLISFSFYTNCKKLFKINTSGDQLKCLDAIRFLSIAWVILGHCFIVVIGFSDNPFIIVTFLKRFSFLIVSNAFFSVDSFFLMSGLLTSYVFLRQLEKSNNILTVWMMIKFYIHRYWRVVPAYAIAMMISLYLTAYLGSGPLYLRDGYEPEFCRTSWWRNVLFINNIVDAEKWCFGVSWYLANDMQFHIFAPVVLIPMALGKRIITGMITAVVLVGNILAIVLTLYFHPGTEMAQFGKTTFHDFFVDFYILPWCRVGPYLIGLLLGYALFLYKKKTIIKFSKHTNIFLWCLSLITIFVLIFCLYPDAKGDSPLSEETHFIYQASCKLAWSLCLSFMIYSCVTGNGGIINDFLSMKIWVPLSRLTYGAFLTHVIILVYFNSTQEHLVHLQDSVLIYYFIANLVFSFVASFLFSLFFEIPLIGLEKFIFKH